MLISKEQFCHFVNRYKHCIEEQDNFNKAVHPFGSIDLNIGDEALEGLSELLVIVSECENEDDIFFWWIHECDEDNHILTVTDASNDNETEYDVLTPEGLYNYLYDMYHHED